MLWDFEKCNTYSSTLMQYVLINGLYNRELFGGFSYGGGGVNHGIYVFGCMQITPERLVVDVLVWFRNGDD